MVNVISEADIAEKMNQAVAQMPGRYTKGVNRAVWNGPSIKGQTLYEAKMADPAVLARRATGIAKVSDTQWRADSIAKGSTIIGARYKGSIAKQQTNFRPFRQKLEALILPDRVADPQMNLVNRAGAVVAAMVETKNTQG